MLLMVFHASHLLNERYYNSLELNRYNRNSIFQYHHTVSYRILGSASLYTKIFAVYQKVLAGMALQLARFVTLIVLDVVARKTYIEEHAKNVTINCIFHLHNITSSFNGKWIALAQFLQSTFVTMLSIGGIEFLASQTPYSGLS